MSWHLAHESGYHHLGPRHILYLSVSIIQYVNYLFACVFSLTILWLVQEHEQYYSSLYYH
jgi:hypothetical protein